MAFSVYNVSSGTFGDVGASAISNNTNSTELCTIEVGQREVNITIHVLTLFLGLAGNILLVTAYVRIKEPIMLLIANMAASDLLVAIFLIPRLIAKEAIGSYAFLVHGKVGLFLCKICVFLPDLSLSVSTQSLLLIAVERFLGVVYPILYKKITLKIRRLLIASTWIVGMAIHAPYLYTLQLIPYGNTGLVDCFHKFDQKSAAFLGYNMFLYVTVLFMPLLVISILYTTIVIKLRKDKMATNRSVQGVKRNKERNRNLKRMVIATVAAFLICWALYIVHRFIELFSSDALPECSKTFQVVAYVSDVLSRSYCAVNPCICFLFVRSFSRELKIMFKRKRQSVKPNSKAKGESSLSRNCRIELPRSFSETGLRMNLVSDTHSNVSTPSLGANRTARKDNNLAVYRC